MIRLLMRAQVVDAVDVVGMGMGVDQRVDRADAGVEALLAQVGAGVDQDALALGTRSGSSSAAACCAGRGERQTAQSQPICGTPEEVPQPSTSRAWAATLGNRRWKLAVVAASISATRQAPHLGQHLGDMRRVGGLVGPATQRHRCEVGRVGFQEQRGPRACRARSRAARRTS